MKLNFLMQLFGGGGSPSVPETFRSAAGSKQGGASIDNASVGEREAVRKQLTKKFGRQQTNVTGGQADTVGAVKKALLGE